jgi:hypothetical protein
VVLVDAKNMKLLFGGGERGLRVVFGVLRDL